MFEWVTMFMFTDKAKVIQGNLQRSINVDLVMIFLLTTYLLYVTFSIVRRKAYFHPTLIPISLIILFFGLISLAGNYQRYRHFQDSLMPFVSIYENQEYKTIEGTISVQHEQPAGGHTSGDIILVDSVQFEINCYTNTIGYNETIAYGAILTDGAKAKIYYYASGANPNQKLILRIDIQDNKSNIHNNDPVFECTR